MVFWARKETGQRFEKSAEQEDLDPNMKQTRPDQSMPGIAPCCSEW